MASQPTLLPALLALQSPSTVPLLLSRLSLQALRIQPYLIRDDIYTATTTVIPGQSRNLRLRAERRALPALPVGMSTKGKEKARENEADDKDDGHWDYSLTYLSPPMNGREYAEMSVRSCIGVEIVAASARKDIEGFIDVLGFKISHSYTRSGYLVHLPLPFPSSTPLTLHLAITRVQPGSAHSNDKPDTPNPGSPTSEPFLVTLQPSRPVQAVSVGGEPGLEDMMRVIREVADRIEGVQWTTGRS